MYSNFYSGKTENISSTNKAIGLICSEGIKSSIQEFNLKYLFKFKINMENQNFKCKYNVTKEGDYFKLIIDAESCDEAIQKFSEVFKDFIPITIDLNKEQYDMFISLSKSHVIDDLIVNRIGCISIIYNGGLGWK